MRKQPYEMLFFLITWHRNRQNNHDDNGDEVFDKKEKEEEEEKDEVRGEGGRIKTCFVERSFLK